MTVSPEYVNAVRSFNRFYTQKIGVLNEGWLNSAFSLTELRVLYELSQHKTTSAAELAANLALDAGYLSRILQRFQRKRYISRSVAEHDGRRRMLSLTHTGRRAFAPLNQRSQEQVAAMLTELSDAQRARLLAAMDTIRSVQDLEGIRQRPIVLRNHHPGDIGWVIQRHSQLYTREYGWNEEFEALAAEIAAKFLRHHDPKRERCWIAERDGHNLGCVFLVSQSDTVAKLRLLLVEPDARGLGLGRRLVEECIRFARQAGYREMVLWTQSILTAARHIYAATGFTKVAEEPHHSFGHDLIAETWELKL
jgi:DNA-binding MarR family transcriptional regulator/N-acetylglutamate synthase-like GNAT family acetyltransferase